MYDQKDYPIADNQIHKIKEDTFRAMEHLLNVAPLNADHILVVGTSTSEVAGKKIGTGGSLQIAQAIYQPIYELSQKHGFQLAFQCCEHLNRALVIEKSLMRARGYVQVTVTPAEKAGGSLATFAFRNLKEAVLIESIQADAGIDIGETMIGMHLKPVVVPIRFPEPTIGQARVVLAKTRPKLIGGPRAIYDASF